MGFRETGCKDVESTEFNCLRIRSSGRVLEHSNNPLVPQNKDFLI
jgi:hypothetical protein